MKIFLTTSLSVMKAHRFDSIEPVKEATTKALNSILETDFQGVFDEHTGMLN